MIHQFIFAAPRPGLSTADFQRYWVDVHAVRYASRIPQILRYLIDTRIPFALDRGPRPFPYQGIAEIWLADEAAQLASLQSEEFRHGARADEPNWAAFWLTIGLDTRAHELVPGPVAAGAVKLTTVLKRRSGLDLSAYRKQALDSYAPVVSGLPGVRRHLHCHTRDGAYEFGEARFDSVEQLWFDDTDALRRALQSEYHAAAVVPALAELADPNQLFSLTAVEHRIALPVRQNG